MTDETEYEPNFRLEIGTDDEDQVVITVQERTHEWWGIGTVYGQTLTEAMNNARKLIVEHTG